MRRSADHLFHALKDQLRSVRYTIRAEADAPGGLLPRTVANIDLAPLIAVGSVVGTPALRAVDGFLSQVESLATDVIRPAKETSTLFPMNIAVLFDEERSFTDLLYDVYKQLLHSKGVGNALISEYVLDEAQTQFRLRNGDARPGKAGAEHLTQLCAGLAVALAEARPIRKMDLAENATVNPRLMLAPNVYCAMVIGLAINLISRDPSLRAEWDAVQETIESVVDARFDRFKRALSGKFPAVDLARQFEAILPFIP